MGEEKEIENKKKNLSTMKEVNLIPKNECFTNHP